MIPFEGEIQVKDGPGRAYKIAAIAGTNDGQRPSTFLADEIHEWVGGNKERVHLVISNGCGKRDGSRSQHHHTGVRPGHPGRQDARLRPPGQQRRDQRR